MMNPLTILGLILGGFGAAAGSKWLDASVFNPMAVETQEGVSARMFERQMKGLGMISQQQMAKQSEMFAKMEAMQEKQHGWDEQAGLQAMLAQMAMGSQAAGAAEGQAFVGGAMQPEQAMPPGMGLVDSLR